MEENNTREHFRRFERLYQFFGVKTEAEQPAEEVASQKECNLKSWRTERAKRRVVAE